MRFGRKPFANRHRGDDPVDERGLRGLVTLCLRDSGQLPEAKVTAKTLVTDGAVSTEDVLSLSRAAIWAMEQDDGWPVGLVIGDIAFAARAALPRAGAAYRLLGCDRVEIAHLALIHRPDANLLREATLVGAQVLADAEAAGDTATLGSTAHRLGCLYLDPWSHSAQGYHDEHRLWLSLAADDAAVAGLPEPLDALHRADVYLRVAEEARTGPALGLTLKARAQCLAQLRDLGAVIAERTIEDLCTRAGRLLPPELVEERLALETLSYSHVSTAAGS
ncbi:hypothetical protein [Amycolatopsis sp. NPDC059657]|uniref:hypothetical protein n=1 Tax=Amycolatopsis sp. NPDC059657 TaxID=3346899 RepID=UPI0036729647